MAIGLRIGAKIFKVGKPLLLAKRFGGRSAAIDSPISAAVKPVFS